MDYEPEATTNPINHAPDADEASHTTFSDQFNDPDGDIILRTSDMVDFRVFKVILGLASPVFKTMFNLPQPATVESSDPVPIVSISESSAVLSLLLQFCYPVEVPQLVESDVSLIGNVLAAALKYELSAVMGPVKKALRDRAERTDEGAIAAYAIACHLKQEDDAHAAAKACLKFPFPWPKVPQLTLMSAMDYYNLFEYHKAASNVVVAMFENGSHKFCAEICAGITPIPHRCSDGSSHLEWQVGGDTVVTCECQWWKSAKSTLVSLFKLAPLDPTKLSLSTIAPGLLISGCASCKEEGLYGWEEAREAILAHMKETIDEIDLKFSWK